MKKKQQQTPEQVQRWFLDQIKEVGPVAEGSLSLRKSPCIRPNCASCAAGDGHSSYALYGRRGGKRFSIYIPKVLAPDIQKAVENGRKLKDLINEAGVRYALALKAQHRDGSKR
jgi:hypothetical protein